MMDRTNAYPGKELKKWKRSIVLEKPLINLLFDEVGSEPGFKIQARFFPGADNEGRNNSNSTETMYYKINDNYVLISDQHNKAALIPLV